MIFFKADRFAKYLSLYWIFTWILFFFGPIDWRVRQSGEVLLFLSAFLTVVWVGWMIGSRVVFREPSIFAKHKFYAWYDNALVYSFMAIMALTYLYAKSIQMTGLGLMEAFSVASNASAENYAQMVRFSSDRVSNPFQSLMVAILAPFFWLSVYVSATKLSERKYRLLFTVLMIFYVIFIMAKGSDKEIAELCVFAFLLALTSRKRFNVRWIVIAVLVSMFMLYFISGRKMGRGAETCFMSFCAPATQNPLIESFYLMSAYFTQGYKGLDIALSQIFYSPSPCLSPMFSSFFGAVCSSGGPVISKINLSGEWTSVGHWVSVFSWLGNVGGVWVSLIIFFVHSIFFVVAIRIARDNRDNFFVFIFIFYSILFYLYVPANNQVFLSLDSAFLFLASYAYVINLTIFKRRRLSG